MSEKAAQAAFFMPMPRAYAVGLIFLALSWLSFDHYRPWVNFHAELLAFLGLSGMLLALLRARFGPLVLPRVGLWVAMAMVVPWVQYATGVYFFVGDALLSSLYLSALLMAIIVGGVLVRADTGPLAWPLMGLMHSLWIAALVSAAIGLAQWLHVEGPLGMYVVHSDFGVRAMGNLGQPNQLATLLLMGMVALAYGYERGAMGRVGLSFGVAFLTGVLVLTQSRAGMLSVMVLAAYLMWKSRMLALRLPGKAVACWVTCFVIGTLVLPYVSALWLQSDVRSIQSPEAISQRWRMWQQIAYAVAQSPWTGYGWNQTPAAQAAGSLAFPGSIPYTYAHNFVMDMLAWNGVPLGLLLTGAIAYWFVSRLHASRRLEAVYAMACLLPVAVHSLLEYPFAYAYFLIAAGLLVGVVEAAQAPSQGKRGVVLNVRAVWVFVSVWVLAGAALTYEYLLIEEDFRVVRFENLHIGKTPPSYAPPRVWMLSHMAAMLQSRRLIVAPHMPQADLEVLRRVSQRFADNVPHFRYALALALNGDPEGAVHQLRVIRGIYGDLYYASCLAELRRLQNGPFPQLADLAVP